MNYWPAEPTGLPELVEPLIALVRGPSRAPGVGRARAMYGARGWVAHHNTDLWRATAPIDRADPRRLWPDRRGLAVQARLWDHYDYNRDKRAIWPASIR